MRLQSIVAVEEVLRHDPGFANHGHEISISFPARHHMPMQVVLDARSGAFSEIHAQVDSSRIEYPADNVD